jgi:hypothetical protein
MNIHLNNKGQECKKGPVKGKILMGGKGEMEKGKGG